MPRFTKKVQQSRKRPITFSELDGSAQSIFCVHAKAHPPLSATSTPGGLQRELCRNAARVCDFHLLPVYRQECPWVSSEYLTQTRLYICCRRKIRPPHSKL